LEEYDAEVELNFRETIQPGQGVRITQSFREAGKITRVLFHFPPGCNALVEMRLLKDEKPIFPVSGFLALDDATPERQNLDIDYYAKEPLTLEVLNRDAVNPHTPTCTVTIKYKKPWWERG
jgi:hypothetical protein